MVSHLLNGPLRPLFDGLGVSSDTVYRWIDKQAMPAHRMGRFWKFKKDEVDEWVKGGGAADTPKSGADQA